MIYWINWLYPGYLRHQWSTSVQWRRTAAVASIRTVVCQTSCRWASSVGTRGAQRTFTRPWMTTLPPTATNTWDIELARKTFTSQRTRIFGRRIWGQTAVNERISLRNTMSKTSDSIAYVCHWSGMALGLIGKQEQVLQIELITNTSMNIRATYD